MITTLAIQTDLQLDNKYTLSSYEAGAAEGAACRHRAETPSLYLMVAKNDDFALGFKAGYFQRAEA